MLRVMAADYNLLPTTNWPRYVVFNFIPCIRSTAYFMIALPRSYIDDRGWSMSYLGPVLNDSIRHAHCARLALMKGFDHFSWNRGDCYSSYAMPANVLKMDNDFGRYRLSPLDHREFVRPYFIKGMSKLSLL